MLTFAELETSTCTGLSGFLSLDLASVAGEEAVRLQNRAVSLSVHFAKSAGYCKAESFCLTFDSAAIEVGLDVERSEGIGNIQGLTDDEAEGILFEVLVHSAAVDGDVAFTGAYINASNC